MANHARAGESNNAKAYVLAIILEWESQAMLRPRVVAAIVITSIATSYDYSYKACTATQRYRDADLGLRS